MDNFDAPAPTPTNQPAVTRDSVLPSRAKAALVLFSLLSALILVFLPRLVTASPQPGRPPLSLLLGACLMVIGFTALLFHYLGKLQLGLSNIALVLAFGFNAVIVIIKFALSPLSMYIANQRSAFDTQLSDPNTLSYYFLAGSVVLFLYVGVFGLLYKYFRKRFQFAQTGQKLKFRLLTRKRLMTLIVICGLILAGGGGLLLLLLMGFGASLSYLMYISSVLGLPILFALMAAIILAYRGFAVVEQQALRANNAILLTSFFWLGGLLILAYHVLWVIFMLVLVQLWPFNTYTSK